VEALAQKQGLAYESAEDRLRVIILHFPDLAPRGGSQSTNLTSSTTQSGGEHIGETGDQSPDLAPPRDMQLEANDVCGESTDGDGGGGGAGCNNSRSGPNRGSRENSSELGGIDGIEGGGGNGSVERGNSGGRKTVVYWTRSRHFPEFDVEVIWVGTEVWGRGWCICRQV
jgi:hypothetical protein